MDQTIIMQSYWNDIGLNATINVMQGGTLRDMMKPVGTYEGIAAHNGGMQPPYKVYLTIFHNSLTILSSMAINY